MDNRIVKNSNLEILLTLNLTCPKCNSRLEEEWEEEVDKYGDETGYEFEIYECYNCGYKENI